MGRGRGSGGRGCWRVGEKDCGLGVMGDLREMRETSTGRRRRRRSYYITREDEGDRREW